MSLFTLGITGEGEGPPQPPITVRQEAATPSVTPAAQLIDATETAPASSKELSRSVPVEVHAPAINLHTDQLLRLGLTPDGRLEVPENSDTVGWYERGPAPGQVGPAVLAGHVDSDDGPAVFYRIGALRPGNEVKVRRVDGKTAVYRVYAVESYPKSDFPTEKVYADTEHAELRLITCGGSFNTETQHYLSNIVAYARMVATR